MNKTSSKARTGVVRLGAPAAQLAGLRACVNQLDIHILQAYWCGGNAVYAQLVAIIDHAITETKARTMCVRSADACPDGTFECGGICVPKAPEEAE